MKPPETFLTWALQAGHLYWILFVAVFLAVAIWESFHPVRSLSVPTGRRWGNHALLFGVSAALQTAAVRLAPVGAAGLVQSSPFGLLNHPAIPFIARCILAILILDLLRYWTHRTYHSFFVLWRVHEIHHSDPDYDVSTATRFHPLDILPPQAIHVAVVLLLAPPPIAVVISELSAMLINFISHANASFPPALESALQKLFITPDLHRIHHSEEPSEQSRNFGQTFSCWDRLFNTYSASAQAETVVTGVKDAKGADLLGVAVLLGRPFRALQKNSRLG